MTDTTSIKTPTPLTSGDFTAAEEPFALFGEWFAEAVQGRAERSQRHGARHRRCRRPARCAHGVDERLRCRRLCLLQPYRQRKGPRTRRKSQGRVAVSLEVAATPGAHPRARDAGDATRKPTSILRPARSRPRSAPGPASNRSRWKAVLPSSRRSRWSRPNTSSARCRGRRAGAAGASRRNVSSSGTTARSACTTASNSAARAEPAVDQGAALSLGSRHGRPCPGIHVFLCIAIQARRGWPGQARP